MKEISAWMATRVLEPNRLSFVELGGGSRELTGITPLFYYLQSPARKNIVIEVWIESGILDAHITRIRCSSAFGQRTVEVPPEVILRNEPLDVRKLLPAAFDVDGVK